MNDPEPVTYCARHPHTETVISCGRCGVPICPQCMVYTPGGIRCPDCARLRRPVMYELEASHYLRAIGAAAVMAIPLGIAGAILLPPTGGANFILLAIALLAGVGAGAAMGEAILWATSRKRGVPLQVIAVCGIVMAAVIRIMLRPEFGGFDVQLITRDLGGLFAVVVGAVSAWGRLR